MEIIVSAVLLSALFFMVAIYAIMGLPGPTYLFGFKRTKIKYQEQVINLFYKSILTTGEFGVGGSRNLKRVYLLRDSSTRWSGFYVKLVLNNSFLTREDIVLSVVEVHGFKEIDLWSFLHKLIILPSFEIDRLDYAQEQEILKRRFQPILDQLFVREVKDSMDSLSKSLKRKKAFRWLEKLIGR